MRNGYRFAVFAFLFILIPGMLGYSNAMMPVSESEGDAVHLTQIYHVTYNPTGPYSSTNCGPASFAMCLRCLGYYGFGNTARLTVEQQVDHARALMYPSYSGMTTVTVQGITYNLLSRDSDYSNVGATCPTAIRNLGGDYMTVSNQTSLDKALANGMPVVLYGSLTTTWKAQFSSAAHWSGTGGHYIAVTGKTTTGYYIVNDPLYWNGCELMTYSQLSVFNSGVSGTAFWWKVPAPFVIKKDNGRCYAFMRKISNGYLYCSYQTSANGSWSSWSPITTATQVEGNPIAAEQPNGRLKIFVRGTAGQILMFSEDAYGNMSAKTDFGGETYYPLGVGTNLDGRIEFYCRGIDGKIYKRYQTAANGNFSDWDTVSGGGNMRTGASSAPTSDGRVEVFAGYVNGTSTNLAHAWQTVANGAWTASWNTDFGGHCKSIPTAYYHVDGYIRAYVQGSDNLLYYRTQRDSWANWGVAGNNTLRIFGRPAVETITYSSSGIFYNDMQVFVRGWDNKIYWTRQQRRGTSYTWTDWTYIQDGIGTSNVAAARYDNGRIFVVVRGTNGYLYYRLQNTDAGGWAAWDTLGNGFDFR